MAAIGVTVPTSLAQRIQIDIAKLRQDDRVLKFADRRVARTRKRDGAYMCSRQRLGPTSAELTCDLPNGVAAYLSGASAGGCLAQLMKSCTRCPGATSR
jgi:hypothetical protein